MNKEIIVCGDFNTDFSKDNVFTTMLIEAINTTQLIPADLVLHQTAQYTFMRKYKKRIITSWIDHVLVSSIENVNYLNIMQQLNTNTSDHIPISIQYKLELNENEKTIVNDCQIKIKEINWLDPFQREYYLKMVTSGCSNLITLKETHKKCNDLFHKNIIATQIFNELSSLLIQSNTKTVEYKKALKAKELVKSKNQRKKSNKWWTAELESLHRFRCKKYIEYRDSEWEESLHIVYLIAKLEFKNHLKFVEKEKASKRFRRLNELFKADVNGFGVR